MPILIVDDYHTMRRIVRNLLRQLGFGHIDEVANGAEALTRLREKNYGLILCDWNTEPMTGLELLNEVRSDAKLKDIPFIMITAESRPENILTARQAGVSNYIVKPFNAEMLKGKMMSVLGPFE